MDVPRAGRSLENVLHAYTAAPWRAQRRWIGAILLVVLGLGMTAALYLDITSRAAITGRQIQALRTEIIATELVNADLKSRLAELTSSAAMEERALTLGYEPVETSNLEYLPVPGYVEPEPEILSSAGALRPSAASMPPEYSESLFDWFGHRLESSFSTGGRFP
jgi:hypothetical protein